MVMRLKAPARSTYASEGSDVDWHMLNVQDASNVTNLIKISTAVV